MKNRLALCAFALGAVVFCAGAQADDANPVTDAVSATVTTTTEVVTGAADVVYKAPGQAVDATYKAPGQVVDAVGSVVNNFVPKNKKS